jgi:hypothetical protein
MNYLVWWVQLLFTSFFLFCGHQFALILSESLTVTYATYYSSVMSLFKDSSWRLIDLWSSALRCWNYCSNWIMLICDIVCDISGPRGKCLDSIWIRPLIIHDYWLLIWHINCRRNARGNRSSLLRSPGSVVRKISKVNWVKPIRLV